MMKMVGLIALGLFVLLLGISTVLYYLRHVFRRLVRREVLAALQRGVPGFELLEETPEAITFRSEASEQQKLFLGKIYYLAAQCASDPEARHAVYRPFVAALAEIDTPDLDDEETQQRLMPRLVAADFGFEGNVEPLLQPLPGTDLSVAYVLDSDQSVVYLDRRQVEESRLTEGDVHRLAMDNLRAATGELTLAGPLEREEMKTVMRHDSYDAARLLLVPELLREGEEVAAIVPDRDVLVLAPITGGDSIWGHLATAAENALTPQTALSRRPYRVTRQGIEEK